MSRKLKPCPFCGGEAVLLEMPYGRLQAVRCNECGVAIRSAPSISLAIKAWNRRTTGWIKTSERLPKPFERVLGVFQYADEMFVASGKYRDIDRSFVTDYEEEFWVKDVPYWMPLPEPPEVEE